MTRRSVRIAAFEKWVKQKFKVYNSLFLNLSALDTEKVGILIPLLQEAGCKGLIEGKDPRSILDTFFRNHTAFSSETEKIAFMFKVIQYVERQVVLFDSVEDAAFGQVRGQASGVSWHEMMTMLQNRGRGPEFCQKLSSFSARLVLTAHPTQFYPRPVLDIIADLRRLVKRNDITRIDLTLQQLGMTSLLNTKQPTPFEEAQNLTYYLKQVYYDAIGELYTTIKENLEKKDFDNPNLIQLGFWPGGDRDGNPYVTSQTTMKVADDLRMSLMKCYYRDVKRLARKLTFRDIDEALVTLKKRLYRATYEPENGLSYQEILNPLVAVRELVSQRHHGLYLKDLNGLIDKVKIFRSHFAVLDIRQDHRVHRHTVETILRKAGLISQGLDDLSDADLTAILTREDLLLDVTQYDDELIRDTLRTISSLKEIQAKNGEAGCHRYIISNSTDPSAVLFVFALFRWCGWSGDALPFDIVPLFETMEGMQNSQATMEALFNDPVYRKHLQQRNDRQTVMLGFSDGTKDGGYLQANWSIFKTKEALSKVCSDHGFKAIFFDGRGGPPARGGGKTHRFYASQSDKIAKHEIQLTIQGQTITSRYGTRQHFIHNCEQLLTAGLSNLILDKEIQISPESRELLEEMASLSYKKYSSLKKHPMFIPYLEKKSTLPFYTAANIGSRPARRDGGKKLELSDLRAIPFVGSWSQMKQNVPGYFGVGHALKTMLEAGKESELKRLFVEVPYFKALMLNSMMSLFKCDFDLTRYIAQDPEFTEFWNILYQEYKLSTELLLKISGYEQLMEEEAVSRESIEIRKEIVLPLLIIQQAAMQKLQQGTKESKSYEKLVQRSLYGNINASRNSA